jgi:hypothetical protein
MLADFMDDVEECNSNTLIIKEPKHVEAPGNLTLFIKCAE